MDTALYEMVMMIMMMMIVVVVIIICVTNNMGVSAIEAAQSTVSGAWGHSIDQVGILPL